MEEKILFVDDDPNILEGYQCKLQHVLHVRTAEGPMAGLREIRERGPFAVVVADMNMPTMNGVEFLKNVQEIAPDTVRMMLTGNADVKTAMQAVNDGNVFRFLTKPCPSKLMGDSLVAAIKQFRLISAEKELLGGTLMGTAELLTEILSWVSPDTFGRTIQLKNTVKSIASKLNVDNAWEIDLAATLCEIGVLAIPAEILAKQAAGEPLTDEEKRSLESVPSIGHDMLERIPRLEAVADIILYQDKRRDGEGFPEHQSLADKEIPLGSQIIKVASDYQKLRASGKTWGECLKEMRGRSSWYHPGALEVLFSTEPAMASAHEAAQQRVVSVLFRDLKPGHTLSSPILTATGRKLVGEGAVITDTLMLRLRKYLETNSIKEPIEVLVHVKSE